MELPQELIAKIDEIITHYPASRRSAVLSVLHVLQKHDGYISDDSVTWTAEKLTCEVEELGGVPAITPAIATPTPADPTPSVGATTPPKATPTPVPTVSRNTKAKLKSK